MQAVHTMLVVMAHLQLLVQSLLQVEAVEQEVIQQVVMEVQVADPEQLDQDHLELVEQEIHLQLVRLKVILEEPQLMHLLTHNLVVAVLQQQVEMVDLVQVEMEALVQQLVFQDRQLLMQVVEVVVLILQMEVQVEQVVAVMEQPDHIQQVRYQLKMVQQTQEEEQEDLTVVEQVQMQKLADQE